MYVTMISASFMHARIILVLVTASSAPPPAAGAMCDQERWKLPMPSWIATRSFSRMMSFELYSGSFR